MASRGVSFRSLGIKDLIGIWILIGYCGIQRSMRRYLASHWLQVDKLTLVTQVDEEVVRTGQEVCGTRTEGHLELKQKA